MGRCTSSKDAIANQKVLIANIGIHLSVSSLDNVLFVTLLHTRNSRSSVLEEALWRIAKVAEMRPFNT